MDLGTCMLGGCIQDLTMAVFLRDWTYYDANGHLHNGWLSYGGAWYYCEGEYGCLVSGTQYINGKNYTFSDDGKLIQ